jgi:putative membrane protein
MADPQHAAETIRVHQANERTMLAWIRTGIALMAFGFAIARFGVFLRQIASVGQPPVHQRTIGSAWVGAVLVGLGMVANLLATVRFARIRGAIERGETGAPDARMVYVFGGLATAIGLVMTVLLARALGD